MNVSTALSQVNSISSKFESIFEHLESLFPQLGYKNNRTSFTELKETISSISSSTATKSATTITNFSEKYTPIFDKLNEKIKDLKELDKMIAEVKEDSEQMELIALNAMVISVKSGEKGLAFSKITENLQRLSKDMFVYSDKLSGEEALLLEQINSLKNIFTGIIDSQRSISSKDAECSSDIQRMVANVNPSVSDLASKVDSIFPAIDRTKSVLSSKNQLANNFNSLNKAISELSKHNPPRPGSEEELDYLCFEISVYEKALSFLSQVSMSISQACSSFAGNWQEVVEIMERADTMRMDFESRFLNNHAFGNDNIARQVSSIADKYKQMVTEFSNYHSVQKDLQGTCQNITGRAKTIYSVFENLRPVMSRLHHVRILQQIEVSKNDAITSVQDSVTDMDNLINSANASLDGIQGILESFIQETGTMLSNFVVSISKDNDNMIALRNEKELTYGDLTNGQGIIAGAFNSFAVFTDDFQKKCVSVQQNLQDFMRLNTEVMTFSNELESEKNALIGQKTSLMNEKGLVSWSIRNPGYVESLSQIK
jgi:hypothetical protein